MFKELDPSQQQTLAALRNIDRRIAELTDAREQLRAQLIDTLGDADTALDPTTGKPAFTYRQARRFNTDKAASFLTPEQLRQCLPDEPDARKVKAQLTQAQLDECLEFAGPRRFVLAK